MPPQSAQSTPDFAPEWLWAWNGACIGYRAKDSLFTSDGIEIGRFCGREVYAPTGHYLGELNAAADGKRLITNVYKRSRTFEAFVPGFGRTYRQPPDRGEEQLFCGHESFPDLRRPSFLSNAAV